MGNNPKLQIHIKINFMFHSYKYPFTSIVHIALTFAFHYLLCVYYFNRSFCSLPSPTIPLINTFCHTILSVQITFFGDQFYKPQIPNNCVTKIKLIRKKTIKLLFTNRNSYKFLQFYVHTSCKTITFFHYVDSCSAV